MPEITRKDRQIYRKLLGYFESIHSKTVNINEAAAVYLENLRLSLSRGH